MNGEMDGEAKLLTHSLTRPRTTRVGQEEMTEKTANGLVWLQFLARRAGAGRQRRPNYSVPGWDVEARGPLTARRDACGGGA